MIKPPPAVPLNARTTAWIVLMAATAVAWLFGNVARDDKSASHLAIAGVITTAFIKIWIIGYQFMELRSAPRLLRHAFDAWTVVVCTVLVVLLT